MGRISKLWMMFSAAVMGAALLGAAATAEDGEPPASDRAAIQEVISDQLAAFLREDGTDAFSYASPGIQRMFETPDRFRAMVRRDYAAVYRPQSIAFKELALVDDAFVQKVFLIDPDGMPVVAAYRMERQANGDWKINGVILLRRGGEAT